MDSPLNLAHRCHRKAEYYLNDHRFKEAIDCHLRAAGHITEALLTTSCQIMRSSLETQKSFHLSQEKVLKLRELCENQKILNYRQELIQRQQLRERFGFNLDNNSLQTPIRSETNPEVSHKMENKSSVMNEILDVMSEHDSLLQFLIEKRSVTQSQSTTESVASNAETVVTRSSPDVDSMYKSGTKKPKDDKIIIEELQTVNEKLRQLVFELFGELELSQKENISLKAENQRLREESRQPLVSTVPELPPLEPPALLY